MPSDERTVRTVQAILASASKVEAVALEEAADEADRVTAQSRMDDIAVGRDAYVTGATLEYEFARLERS